MKKYLGLDWARRGWFGVILNGNGEWSTDLFPSIGSVWKYHSDADRIFIDIPIGLPATERRVCDVEARKRLKQRGRSVFYTPIRDAVYETNLEAAKQLNEDAAGFSVQNQAWSIISRIREVDEFLDMYPSARDRLYETHPEMCFYSLNGQTPLPESKTTEDGIRHRTELLVEEYPEAATILQSSIEQYTTPDYSPMVSSVDDILDAMVAAITAQRDLSARSTLPRSPPRDERNLPMRIVYPSDPEQTRLTALE